MKLTDLSDHHRRILALLKDIHVAGRRHISDLTGLTPSQISPALTRLEAMGYIEKPDTPGRGWTLNESGYALFGLRPPVVDPEPKPESEPELVAPVAGPYEPGKSADIIQAMEIELALEQVHGRLTAPIIPARAARVYRNILADLPPALVDVLAPITAMVEAHG